MNPIRAYREFCYHLPMAGTESRTSEEMLHRGRVQAQGKRQPRTTKAKTKKGKIESSVAWALRDPPSVDAMLAMLDQLWDVLPATEQRVRADCFAHARQFLRKAAERGGMVAPTLKSFRNPKLKGGVRVDIEVWTGQAGVPEQ